MSSWEAIVVAGVACRIGYGLGRIVLVGARVLGSGAATVVHGALPASALVALAVGAWVLERAARIAVHVFGFAAALAFAAATLGWASPVGAAAVASSVLVVVVIAGFLVGVFADDAEREPASRPSVTPAGQEH